MESLIQYHRSLLKNLSASFTRDLISRIDWNERLTGIEGFRGVGKTTLMLQYISNSYKATDNACLYVNLDNIYFPFSDLVELAHSFHSKGGKHLFIDEIHKYPGWSRELKHIYDMIPGLKIVFSGSSILHLQKGKTDLSRRAVIYKMKGLSFREFLQIEQKKKYASYTLKEILEKHETISFELNKHFQPFAYFEKYLISGYLPYYLQGMSSYIQKLNASLSLIIETEVPLISNIEIKNIITLKRFLHYIATRVLYTLNVTRVAEIMQVSRQSIINYIKYLTETEILNSVYSTGSLYGKLSKPEKILLHNPNLCYCLSDVKPDKGTLRETFFVNQLSGLYTVEIPEKGDYYVNNAYIFEIGGKNKTSKQIKKIRNSYLVSDDIEYGQGNRIPLWLFGFLY